MKKKNAKSTIQTSSKTSLASQLLPSWLSRWNVDNIIFAILMATMLISPYYRGLFFAENYLVFHLICTALFIALIAFRWFVGITSGLNVSLMPNRPIDYLFWLLPFTYLISMIGAVEPGLARNEFLRNFNYVVIAIIIIMTVKTQLQQQIAAITFFLTTLWVSIFGHGVMFGVWEFPDSMIGTRLSSVFQYPNTLAAFVGAGYLLGLFLMLYYMAESGRKYKDSNANFKKYGIWFAPLLFIAVTLLFSTMLHTGSRGGWVVFIVVYGISLLVTPLRQKLFYTMLSSMSMAAGVYLYTVTNRFVEAIRVYNVAIGKNIDDSTVLLDSYLAIDYSSYIVKFVLVAVVLYGIAFACNLVYQWISQDQRKFRYGQLALGIVMVVIVVAGISFVPHFLPESANIEALNEVWQRFQTLQNIDSTSTDSLRFTFNRDAIKIVKDYPIFGAGGGAWQGLFQKYQDHPYWSTQAHTYYMQLMAETGIFGFSVLLILLTAITIVFLIVIRGSCETTKLKVLGMVITLIMLLAHNTADFNMAYTIYGGFIWMFLGLLVAQLKINDNNSDITTLKLSKLITPVPEILRNYQNNRTEKQQRNLAESSGLSSRSMFDTLQIIITILVAIVIFFVNVQPLNAINNYIRSGELNRQEKTAEAFDTARTAYHADSKNIDILIYYTNFLNEIIVTETNGERKQRYLQELFAVLTKASEQFPYNTRIKNQLVDMYFTHGYSVDAVNELNQLIEIAPYTPSYYDRAVEYNYRIGLLYSEQNDQQTAQKYWQQAVDAYNQYTKLYTNIAEQKKPNEDQFLIKKETNFYVALAYFALQQSEQAEKALQKVVPDHENLQELVKSIQQIIASNLVTDEVIKAWLKELP